MVNYVLDTYANDNVIPKTDTQIMKFTQFLNRTSIEYAELHWSNGLDCSHMYDAYLLGGSFLECLQHYITQIMDSFWSLNKLATVQDLVPHATSLARLPNGSSSGEGMHRSNKPINSCDGWRSQDTVAMYLKPDGLSTAHIYGTTDKRNSHL